jgi:ATP-binding cassette subfamily B protein
VTTILAALLGVASTYLQQSITEAVVCDLRDQLFASLIDQPVGYWVDQRGGEVTSRLLNDVGAIDDLLASASVNLLSSLLSALAVTGLMFTLDWRLALVTLVLLPLGFVPLRLGARRIGVARLRVQEQFARLTAYLQEVLGVSGATLVRSHNRGALERDRFGSLNRELRRREVTAAMTAQWVNASVTGVGAICPAILLLVGAYLVVNAGASVGTVLVTALVLSNRLGQSLQGLAGTATSLVASLPVWRRLFETLDDKPKLEERPGATALDTSSIAGAITLERVVFSYPGQDRPAVMDASVEIAPGQRVAIVGPTGAGKSTLVGLIARFADPQYGTVRLDGHDLRELTLGTITGAFGVVFQDNFLFHAPLAENLRYARLEASDEELHAAVEAACLTSVVDSLPDGLETVVGERGHRLSGGEQQRVAIARTILKDPRVLVLDEATSNLDQIVEAEVQDALARLFAGRTTLIVAHRLSTIRGADLILVMNDGAITERGRHDELIDRDGLYARLYRTQAIGIA